MPGFYFDHQYQRGWGGGGARGNVLANHLVQISRTPCFMVPKPLVLWFLLVGSACLIPLSQRLAYRVACSIVVVSLEVRALVLLHYLCYINNN